MTPERKQYIAMFSLGLLIVALGYVVGSAVLWFLWGSLAPMLWPEGPAELTSPSYLVVLAVVAVIKLIKSV